MVLVGRRNRRERDEPEPLNLARATGGRRTEVKKGEPWIVQDIPEVRASKEYTCPGCVIPIAVGVSHVCVWLAEGFFGDDAAVRDRRHWHTSCWRRFG